MEILEESDAESELAESEEEGNASGDEEEKQEVVEEEKKSLQAEDLADAQLWREELEGEEKAPGWKRTLSVKQEVPDYRTDPGWLDQWQAKEEMNPSFLIKQEAGRRRQIGVIIFCKILQNMVFKHDSALVYAKGDTYLGNQ